MYFFELGQQYWSCDSYWRTIKKLANFSLLKLIKKIPPQNIPKQSSLSRLMCNGSSIMGKQTCHRAKEEILLTGPVTIPGLCSLGHWPIAHCFRPSFCLQSVQQRALDVKIQRWRKISWKYLHCICVQSCILACKGRGECPSSQP